MRLLIGIVCNDFARVSIFMSCVLKCQERLLKDGTDATVETLIGGDWVGARNSLVHMTLDGGYDYLWFMDDDHAFSPGTPSRLLAHEVPLVVPVCLKRFPPYTPVNMVKMVEGADARYLPLHLPDSPPEGLIELEAGGCAGMMIHRSVLEVLDEPWFELTPLSEDFVFCEKARKAGFTIHCDLSARIGHITTATITPVTDENGEWLMGVTVGQDTQISVPFHMMAAQEA